MSLIFFFGHTLTVLFPSIFGTSFDKKKEFWEMVVVTMQYGKNFDGEVINADFHTDIAVVRINAKVPLPAAKLGSSSKLPPRDFVIALGFPLSLQNTVTTGIVSYVDHKNSDLGLGEMRKEYYYLQTDCVINEGSSGGPLLNLDGEVIGINTMKALAADGVSFAIPIDSAIKTIEHFKKHGRVENMELTMSKYF